MINKISAIVLAAGKNTRFWPLKVGYHKSMIKLLGKPILEYTLLNLYKTGVKHIILVCSKNQKQEMEDYFSKINKLNSLIDFVIQKKALGQGNAILSAEHKLKSDTFFVLNANQINASDFLKDLLIFKNKKKAELVILGKKTDNPSEYGIFVCSGEVIKKIVEKPTKGKEPSNIRVAGVYLLNRNFLDFMKEQETQEYQFEASINKYCLAKKVCVFKTEKETITLKYPWQLFIVKNYLLNQLRGKISTSANISSKAIIKNKNRVIIEEGALIGDFALVEGPAYIGPNAILGAYSTLRKKSVLEAGAQIQRYSDVSNSIIFTNTHIHSGFIGDSIISEECRIGADFLTANKRLDRDFIKIKIKDKIINSRIKSLGVIMGCQTKIGVRVTTMPGTTIGNNCLIGPGKMIKNNIHDNTSIL